MEKILGDQNQKWLRYVLSGLFLLFITGSYSLLPAQSVTITTDKDDYFPGEWVVITGKGWVSDDSVRLNLSHLEPLPDPTHSHDPWFVKPDLNGDLYYEWFVLDQEIGTSFYLEALGYPSGNLAGTYFSDSKTDTYPSLITSFTGGRTYCQNETPSNLTVTWITTSCTGTQNGNGNTNLPVTVTWYRNNVNSTIGGISLVPNNPDSKTSSSYTPSVSEVGTYYYYAVISWNAGSNCAGGGSIITTWTEAVTVKSVVTGNEIGSPQSICRGLIAEALTGSFPSGGNGSFLYSWQSSTLGSNTGYTTAAGISNEMNYLPGTLNATTWFRRVVTSNGCNNISAPVKITVAPGSTASVSTGSIPVCYGVTSTVDFSGPPDGVITYNIDGGPDMYAYLNHGGNIPSLTTAPITANTTYNLVSVFNGTCNAPVSGSATVLLESIPPVWSTTAGSLDRTVECNDISGLSDAQTLTPVATDNCTLTLVAEKNSGAFVAGSSCIQSGTYSNTWIVRDAAGNRSAVFSQLITVADVKAPTFTRPADITINKDAACSYDISPAQAGDVTDEADNCSTGLQASWADVDATPQGSCEGLKVILRTWSLKDNCGNAAGDQVQKITINDNTAPTFTRPADVTINKDAACSYDISPAKAGDVNDEADNCSTGLQASWADVDATPQGSCEGLKVILRTWSLKDNCGNAAGDQVQKITINDNTPPTFTRPADVTINKDAACSYDISPAKAGDVNDEADNCSTGLQASLADFDATPQGSCEGLKVILRTWSLKDNCGNAAGDQVQKITIIDNTPPTFTRPADATIYKDASCSYDISPAQAGDVIDEADNCSTGLQVSWADVDATPQGSCEGLKVILRTWSLKDNCGNAAGDQVQKITINDNTPPTFTRPADITINKDAACSYDISPAKAGDVNDEADNCSTGLQASWADVDATPQGSCEGLKVILRTWSLRDNCGNAAGDQVQKITIIDNAPPTFTRPADITINKDAACSYDGSPAKAGDVNDEADNCSTGLQASWADVDATPQGSCEGLKVILRTWSLKDNCGNAAGDQVQKITIIDNAPPTFTRPADATIYKDASCSYDGSPAKAGDVTDEADNCSTGLSATYIDTDITPVGSCAGMTVIHRTWSLKDKCDNAADNQVQTITVLDNLAPVFTSTVPERSIVDAEYDPSVCGAVVDYTISANDNCSGSITPLLVTGLESGSVFPLGTTVVTYSAKDNCSNSVTYTFTVRVNPAVTVSELSVISLPTTTDPAEQQYSDQVKLKVIISNGYSICGKNAATGVNFYIGSQLMNASPVAFKQIGKGRDMMAELTVELLEPASANGQMAPTIPGTRTVSARLVERNTTLYKVSDPVGKYIIIKPEDARTVFTGTSLVATSSATSGTAVVTLRATIQDITALSTDPAYDVYSGDIRNAKVRFLNGSTDISGYLTPVLIDQSDKKTAVVTFTWNANIGSESDAEFNIYTEVTGYYVNPSDVTIVTIYKPNGDFITGGGYIIPYKTEGTFASEKDGNLKANFGFNVKYNKKGTNLQGNMNFIIRNRENGLIKTYHIKANAMTSLGVDISKLLDQKAVFVSKANITDITNPLMPVSRGGNLTLQINLSDRGEPGSNDMIGISLWDGGSLLYSNSWNGFSTDQQLLTKGNIVVHSGFSLNPSLTSVSTAKSTPEFITEKTGIDLNVFPNPFTDHLFFEISSNVKGRACLEIFDISGIKLSTMFNDEIDENQFYRFEYQPNKLSSGTIVYRMSIDGVLVLTGRVIHK